jgi:hypothetical protein
MHKEAEENGGFYQLFAHSKFGFSIVDIEQELMVRTQPKRSYHTRFYLGVEEEPEIELPQKIPKEKRPRRPVRHPMTYSRQ